MKTRRTWLVVAGTALAFLVLLVLLLGRLLRAPGRIPSTTVRPPTLDSQDKQSAAATGANRREAVNDLKSSAGSRAEYGPPAALSPSPVEAEKSVGTGSAPNMHPAPGEQKIVASAPFPPAASVLPLAESGSHSAATEEPFELPNLTEMTKTPNLGFPLPAPPPVIPINVSAADFVLDHTVKAHAGWITSVAFSPDGQRLASGGWDQTVRLWDVRTGQQLSILGTRMKEVQALAFSHDGHWLATENSDDTVTVWDATRGGAIRRLTANKPLGVLGSSWVYSIAFSPDGRWLASGVDDKTVRVWDVQTGRVVHDLAALRRSIIYAAFSPDGHWLASGGDDKTIRIWDAVTGHQIRTLSGHKRPIYAVAFSPNGRWLASASADKTVKLWDIATGRELHTLTGHENMVTSIAFSADGHWLASGSWDKTIKIWNVATGHEIQTLTGHPHNIYTVAFDSRGQWLASGSEDGTIKLWRLGKTADKSRFSR